MKHQQAIASHRIVSLQEGIKEINKYLSGIVRMLHDKEQLNAEEIKDLNDDIDEIQTYAEWLAQQ